MREHLHASLPLRGIRRRRCVSVCLTCILTMICLLLAAAPAAAQGIVPQTENGRTVWVDAATPEQQAAMRAAQRRPSMLVYWSNTEQRWRPVPAPPPGVMRSARSAAAEVGRFVARQPTGKAGAGRPVDPNYAGLSRGRAVLSSDIDAAISQAAARHSVDPNLVRAIIKVESDFNVNAVSRKGAMGLMQLMPATARSLNVENPFDPEQNVEGGVRHLKSLLESYGGDLTLSLAAYNAGAGAVERHAGVPPYRETRNYVKRITELYGRGGILSTGPGRAPIRVTRDADGLLRISNTD